MAKAPEAIQGSEIEAEAQALMRYRQATGRETPVLRNAQWKVEENTDPNGIVELDLSSIQAYPAGWLKYRARYGNSFIIEILVSWLRWHSGVDYFESAIS